MDNLKSLGTAVHRATNKSIKNGDSYLGLSTLTGILEAHGIEVETTATLIGQAVVSKSKRAKVVADATIKVMNNLVTEGVDIEAPDTKKFMKLLTDRLFAAATLNDLKLENNTLKQIIKAKDALIKELREDVTTLQSELEKANIMSKVAPRVEKTLKYKFVTDSNPFKTNISSDLNMPELAQVLKDNFDLKAYNTLKSHGKTEQKTITSKKILGRITPTLEKITLS